MTRIFSVRTARRLLAVFGSVTISLGTLVAAAGVATGAGAGWRQDPPGDHDESQAAASHSRSRTGACGTDRWPVKTGTDAAAGRINLHATVPTTIESLISRAAPAHRPANNRIGPTETTVYRVRATLTEYRREGDHDYHLVLADRSGNTMIAEIPDPACVGFSSPLLPGIRRARGEFDAKYAVTGRFRAANTPVTVTGVGFFDSRHGQPGSAPNGIELHPVLAIRFAGTGAGG